MAIKNRFNSVKYLERLSQFLIDTIEAELKSAGYPSLSHSHFEILTYLYRKKQAINMTTIADEIHRKKPTVTILINKLESLHLVQKDASQNDKREFKISLTKEGRAFGKIALKISSKLLSLELWGLEPDESDRLYATLEKIYKHIYSKK